MMRAIVSWSMKFRGLVIAVAAGVMVLGIVLLPQTPVDTLPEFNRPTVEVQAEALGLSAEEVEQFITVPLEQNLLNGVAFLDEIESASLPGLSSVVMTFQPGTDLLDARQVVAERLTQAVGLPEVSKPPQMLQPLSSTSRVAMVRLTSQEQTPIEMSVLARWVIAPRLLGVEGVANVAIWKCRHSASSKRRRRAPEAGSTRSTSDCTSSTSRSSRPPKSSGRSRSRGPRGRPSASTGSP
jgi:Cu/Ag efflux pump CusA